MIMLVFINIFNLFNNNFILEEKKFQITNKKANKTNTFLIFINKKTFRFFIFYIS